MDKKLAEYRAQKSKEYQARKTSNGDSVIQKGWQFLKSWRRDPVSIFLKKKLRLIALPHRSDFNPTR